MYILCRLVRDDGAIFRDTPEHRDQFRGRIKGLDETTWWYDYLLSFVHW